MILFQLKNQINGSLSSLGLTVISPKTINMDALPYVLYITNLTENSESVPMGRSQTTELTFDVICTAKEAQTVQDNIQTCYDYLTSEEFILDSKPNTTISTVTTYQIQDDYDPTSGLNTVVLSMRLNYITLAR